MRNLVKEYIESGRTFSDLKNEFGISTNEFENLICLNYSIIDSPKAAPIVRQCRGIVLNRDTLEIVHYPFYRFFNLDEIIEERTYFDWTKAFALEKIDGSLFGVFNHNGNWYITTRSQVGGMNLVNNGVKHLTFRDLFDEAIGMPEDEFYSQLDANLDYTFELAGPENRIVTPYEETHLYLIGVRDKTQNFHELQIEDFMDKMPASILFPRKWNIMDEHGNFIGFNQLKLKADALQNATDEGFVVVDYTSYNDEYGFYPRLKVKNSAYVALHHLRSNDNVFHYEEILSTIWEGEADEVLANLPSLQEYFNDVEGKLHTFINRIDSIVNELNEYFNLSKEERIIPENKKAFALTVNGNESYRPYSRFLFTMFNKNMTLVEIINENSEREGFFKTLWNNYLNK